MTTTAPKTNDYLKYANLQMAAEAFLNIDGTTRYSGIALSTALKDGNKHASRFTATQATDFAAHWIAVDQKANTSTGFSGTLFKCIQDDPATGAKAGELVMSFRSTEFIDDAARDNQATNALEIKLFGWAFGQIADMEQCYGHLQQAYGLGATNKVSVTGYGLGGHLATAFDMLHPADVSQTYTFNDAGVGRTQNGVSLAATIQQFSARRDPSEDLGGLFTDPKIRSLYESLRSALQGGGKPTDAQRAAIAAITLPAITTVVAGIPVTVQPPNADSQAQVLIEAASNDEQFAEVA